MASFTPEEIEFLKSRGNEVIISSMSINRTGVESFFIYSIVDLFGWPITI